MQLGLESSLPRPVLACSLLFPTEPTCRSPTARESINHVLESNALCQLMVAVFAKSNFVIWVSMTTCLYTPPILKPLISRRATIVTGQTYQRYCSAAMDGINEIHVLALSVVKERSVI